MRLSRALNDTMVVLSTVIFLLGLTLTSGGLISGISWNINGVRKLKALTRSSSILNEADFVFLQETFSTSDERCFRLQGFVGHHLLASTGGRGRPSWGLTTLFKITSFATAPLRRVFSPMDWAIVSRWGRTHSRGILFVNTYLPLHTARTSEADLLLFETLVHDLRCQFPADVVILGGDFNFDPWRTQIHRAAGIALTPMTRLGWRQQISLNECFCLS
jgi:exonuclease III